MPDRASLSYGPDIMLYCCSPWHPSTYPPTILGAEEDLAFSGFAERSSALPLSLTPPLRCILVIVTMLQFNCTTLGLYAGLQTKLHHAVSPYLALLFFTPGGCREMSHSSQEQDRHWCLVLGVARVSKWSANTANPNEV